MSGIILFGTWEGREEGNDSQFSAMVHPNRVWIVYSPVSANGMRKTNQKLKWIELTRQTMHIKIEEAVIILYSYPPKKLPEQDRTTHVVMGNC